MAVKWDTNGKQMQEMKDFTRYEMEKMDLKSMESTRKLDKEVVELKKKLYPVEESV